MRKAIILSVEERIVIDYAISEKDLQMRMKHYACFYDNLTVEPEISWVVYFLVHNRKVVAGTYDTATARDRTTAYLKKLYGNGNVFVETRIIQLPKKQQTFTRKP